jgi:hypothetical protein
MNESHSYRFANPSRCRGNVKPFSLACFKEDEIVQTDFHHLENGLIPIGEQEYPEILIPNIVIGISHVRSKLDGENICGISLGNYSYAHDGSIEVNDVPSVPQDRTLYMINAESISTEAFQTIITQGLQVKRSGKKLRCHACFKCDRAELESLEHLRLDCDNIGGHYTLYPVEGSVLECIVVEIGDSQSHFFLPIHRVNWTLHCFRIQAMSEPKKYIESYDRDAWRIARFLFDHYQEFDDRIISEVNILYYAFEVYSFSEKLLQCLDIAAIRSWIDPILLNVEEEEFREMRDCFTGITTRSEPLDEVVRYIHIRPITLSNFFLLMTVDILADSKKC